MCNGENAGNQHFLLFPLCFLLFQREILSATVNLSSAYTLDLDKPVVTLYPCPKRQVLDSSKLKEFADDNFKSDGNDEKFSKRVENNVGKGEIARCEQVLLFRQCFQKTCTADVEKQGLVVVEKKKTFF